MSRDLPDDWYIEPTGESMILDQEKVAAEIERLRYWLLKLGRDDIINDADKFAGPEEERRRNAVEQGANKP